MFPSLLVLPPSFCTANRLKPVAQARSCRQAAPIQDKNIINSLIVNRIVDAPALAVFCSFAGNKTALPAVLWCDPEEEPQGAGQSTGKGEGR